LKLWNALENRIIYAKNVRQVLAYVESGNAVAGLVYLADTIILKSAHIACLAPKGAHSPIVYPMAARKGSKNLAVTKKFMAFLKTHEASKVFAGFNFIPLNN
jgi:molybdate transport system substrate-binding protein